MSFNDFTPVWSSDGLSQPTLGAPPAYLKGRYTQSGTFTVALYDVNVGNGSNGTGNYYLSLPVNISDAVVQQVAAHLVLRDPNTGDIYFGSTVRAADQTKFIVYFADQTGAVAPWTSTFPVNIATQYVQVYGSVTYESV